MEVSKSNFRRITNVTVAEFVGCR